MRLPKVCFRACIAELLDGGAFNSIEEARTETFNYIEGYYNRVRRHSSLGYKSPLDYEAEYYRCFEFASRAARRQHSGNEP